MQQSTLGARVSKSVWSLISARTFSETGKSYEVCGTVIVNHGSFSAQMKWRTRKKGHSLHLLTDYAQRVDVISQTDALHHWLFHHKPQVKLFLLLFTMCLAKTAINMPMQGVFAHESQIFLLVPPLTLSLDMPAAWNDVMQIITFGWSEPCASKGTITVRRSRRADIQGSSFIEPQKMPKCTFCHVRYRTHKQKHKFDAQIIMKHDI